MNRGKLLDRNFEVLSGIYRPLMEELKKPGAADFPEAVDEVRVKATPSGYPTLLLGGRHVHSPRPWTISDG
jgi:hypothetical protein